MYKLSRKNLLEEKAKNTNWTLNVIMKGPETAQSLSWLFINFEISTQLMENECHQNDLTENSYQFKFIESKLDHYLTILGILKNKIEKWLNK